MENNKKKPIEKNYMIIAIIAGLVLIIVGFIALKGCDKGDKKNNEEEEEIEKIGATEEDIIKAYGMSREDAIGVVSKIYNSDNYEFSATINEDSKYVVTVINTINNNTSKFLVDPASSNGSFYEIEE